MGGQDLNFNFKLLSSLILPNIEAEMGVAYLEINILPCLHEINKPKCINV